MGGGPGKLIEAARWCLEDTAAAAAFADDPGAAKVLAEFGVPQEHLSMLRPTRQDPHDDGSPELQLWAQHADVLRLFAAMRTQWRAVTTAFRLVYLGLDYNALPVVAQAIGTPLNRQLFDQLQVMEREGKVLLNAQAAG